MWNDFANQLEHRKQQNRLRRLTPFRADGIHLIGPDGERLVNFGSNDYLGLAADSRWGDQGGSVGSTASGLVCGWTDRHQVLAERLADFEQTEAAVVFPSGFAACSGSVATLCGAGDLILSDQLNHASLIDGCRLSRAQCIVYPHADCDHVEKLLQANASDHQRVWILSDAVFSMDGDLAPLPRLCDLADQYGAMLLVDEAHGTGVLGETGSGACEHLGVKDRVAVRIGTLSKALGGQGGFVVGPQIVIDYLINHCRSLIYSTALCLPAVECAIDSLRRLDAEPDRRTWVRCLARQLRQALKIESSPHFDSIVEPDVPIVPVSVGSDARAVALSAQLRQNGLFVPAIRPPTVPEGESRLRVSLSAAHDSQMLQALVDALQSV